MSTIPTSTKSRKPVLAVAAALAAAIAMPAEGLYQKVYGDVANPALLTVCWGHTGPELKPGMTFSLAECRAYLDKDMSAAVAAVERCAPGLPEPVLAAFSDAVFNMGPTIACDTGKSTAARLLKAGDLRSACEQLTKWDKARIGGVLVALPGLTKRRAAERELCLKGA